MAQVWHRQQGGQLHSPVSGGELKELAGAGDLLPDDLIWREGMEKWVPARSVRGLFPSAPEPTAATTRRDGNATAASTLAPANESAETNRSVGSMAVPKVEPAGAAVDHSPTGQADPLPLPDKDDGRSLPGMTRDDTASSPSILWAKAMSTWRRSSTPMKAGVIGGAGVVLVLLVLVPAFLLSAGNPSSREGPGGDSSTPSSTSGSRQGAETPAAKGSGKLTRLEFVNTLLAKSGHRKIESLDARLDRSGGGNVAGLGAVTRDRQGRVFVHHALGGRFDHEWWVKTFGEFRVEDFFDPTDNEMLNTNDATLRTGKWTYQCSDGPITFIGSVVEAGTSPTGRRLITVRRFGLFE